MVATSFSAELAAAAVVEYFAGERREMFIILVGSAVAVLPPLALLAVGRDGFAKTLTLTVVFAAFLLCGAAASLLARDGALKAQLLSQLSSPARQAAITTERERMVVVVSKYKYYRYGACVLGLVALAALALSRQGWMHGIAAGLLLLVFAQTLIDHYSERRARHYLLQLA